MTSRKRQATQALDEAPSSCIKGQGTRKKQRIMPALHPRQAGPDAACLRPFPVVAEEARVPALEPLPVAAMPIYETEYIDMNQNPVVQDYTTPQLPEPSPTPSAAPAPRVTPAPPAFALPMILVAGHSLEELGIGIPCYMNPNQSHVLRHAVHRELDYQRRNPPRLPPSKVADLPPKKAMPQYISIPPGATENERHSIEQHNNSVSEKIQRLDRERNNQAAKKSRATRIETLEEYRRLYILTTAMLWFHRLRDAASGQDPDAWEHLGPRVRQDLVNVAEDAARAVESDKLETKKRNEVHQRVQRSHKRTGRRLAMEASGIVGIASTGSVADDGTERLEVVTPQDGGDRMAACEDFQQFQAAPVADMSYAEAAWLQWESEGGLNTT
ncbi:hypothetical protein GQ602_004213 [Ophiocordyceps camponoti-floridani]|uniref:Uncharacterized protein n=1 Tax=Ophiocordyceps camponoti-floridani TaxID=2030778 RepID=A0A8H4Q6F0_9HYPO|nr:hypothetical protein GQ602_004213 [Ophiocordyceps camponoti-floridani]